MRQVDGTKQVHTLWAVKFCPKAGANLFSLMYELLQGNKISCDHQNNIVVNTLTGDIILDGANFLQDSNNERVSSATAIPKRNINNLHVELGHPSETITHITTKALCIQVTGMFKPCKDCDLGKAKQGAVSKKTTLIANFRGKAFFDISTPFTPTLGSKHHWLLVIDDCSDYLWSFFLKEKSDSVETMLGLVNNLKIILNLQMQYLHCNNAGKNQAFKNLQ